MAQGMSVVRLFVCESERTSGLTFANLRRTTVGVWSHSSPLQARHEVSPQGGGAWYRHRRRRTRRLDNRLGLRGAPVRDGKDFSTLVQLWLLLWISGLRNVTVTLLRDIPMCHLDLDTPSPPLRRYRSDPRLCTFSLDAPALCHSYSFTTLSRLVQYPND